MTPHSSTTARETREMDHDNWLIKPGKKRNKYARLLRSKDSPFVPKVHRTAKDKSSSNRRLRPQDLQAIIEDEVTQHDD